VKYSSVLAEDNRVSECLNFVEPLRHVVHDAHHNSRLQRVRPIATGTSFAFNDKLFRVLSSNSEIVTAISVVDGEEVSMTNNEVWQIIRSNILG
jgi:hypothetical protein